jgi:hypothetical protein
MYGSVQGPLSLLLFLPVLPYHYFLRLKIKRLTPFLVLTWLAVAVAVATPHPIVYGIFVALLCSGSVRRRTNEEARLRLSFELLCFPLFFLAAVYIAADFLGVPQLREFSYYQAVAVFVLAILYSHLKGINAELELALKSFKDNKSKAALQSTGVITGVTNRFVLAYVFGFLFVLLLFRHVPFGNLAAYVGHFVVAVLRFIFSLLKVDDSGAVGVPLEGVKQEAIDTSIDAAPHWLTVIEQIMIYAVNIIVLLVILLMLAFFLLRLYRGFYRKKDGGLDYVYGKSEVRSIKRTEKGLFRPSEPKHPIRKKYYRRLNRYFKRGKLSKADTPEEIELKLAQKEDLSDLTKQYNNVRYKAEE